ncbi:hypothetical protein [Mycobacterium paraterrae]|uniref:Uncharacterized protein n=1 Tax=Mycobacterium paraterrae TaxID=577492 RepID=A0ABY3VDS5_9MYCO|nr:hypothetical protein [Mycobacterium paraterrae]UMB67568.1 hypothetical protein MKK62_13655 [Mycobacterium paraterrae]
MDVTHLVAAVIATVTITFGSGIAAGAPLDPPPSDPNPAAPAPTPKLPAMKCWPYGRVGPGSARGGGGVPVYPPPCPPGTPH